MTTIFCTSGQAIMRAGRNVFSTAALSGAIVDTFINAAEDLINVNSRFNFLDVYSTLNDDTKKIIEQVCSAEAANSLIAYDMSGYSSRIEAETMLDVNNNIVLRGLSILRDKKPQDFIIKS